jgi:hypothetical protein
MNSRTPTLDEKTGNEHEKNKVMMTNSIDGPFTQSTALILGSGTGPNVASTFLPTLGVENDNSVDTETPR